MPAMNKTSIVREAVMPQPKSKAETADKDTPVSGMIPPFAATCRATAVAGTNQYSHCLVDEGIYCCYRSCLLSLGYFCLHPRHLEIAARTSP